MTKTYAYEEIALDDLSAADLRDEVAAWDGETRAYRIIIWDEGGKAEPEAAQALVINGRVGIAWGGDSMWADTSPTLDEDIEMWLNHNESFADRN